MTAETPEPAAVVPLTSRWRDLLPLVAMAATFIPLFIKPTLLLGLDWWSDPESGHGLLLAPAAVWLIWRDGLRPDTKPAPAHGLLVIAGAVLLRLASELAAELFTMRFSLIAALVGLVIFFWGVRQVLAWWLPVTLLVLAIPLPELIRSTIALPLQFQASGLGAALLQWRDVPVQLSGNIIQLPGQRLFVTEACSGLRSLTALLSLSFLIGGLWMQKPLTRGALIVLAIPIAVLINGIRVFLTGFLVYFVDPSMGEGFMHLTEGWLLFVVSFALIGMLAYGLRTLEQRWTARGATHA